MTFGWRPGIERHDAPHAPVSDVAGLQAVGVSDAGIAHLTRLRDDVGVWIEFTDTASQWDALRFLRWRYRNGRIRE